MDTPWLDRRTVLKTIGAGVAGSSVLTGSAAAAPGRAKGRRNEVEIVASHDHENNEHLFDLSTTEIKSGWTTLNFDNQTDHTHFVYSSKVPQEAINDADDEDMDLLDFWIETVTNPFQYFMDTLVPGKDADLDDLSDIYPTLFPPWFGDVTFHGGPGLTSGHQSSTSTVELGPGEYIVECYVKDSNNDFHSYLGMIDLLSVTDDETDVKEPKSTVDLTLDNDGLHMPANIRPGQHMVGVEFEAQQPYSNLVGHDIHLIHLEEGTDTDDVNEWMDWANGKLTTEDESDDMDQLISDGTEPETFLGGVQDIWTGDLPQTGYFHVNLKPGDYAWVAEIPDPESKDFLEKFSVP